METRKSLSQAEDLAARSRHARERAARARSLAASVRASRGGPTSEAALRREQAVVDSLRELQQVRERLVKALTAVEEERRRMAKVLAQLVKRRTAPRGALLRFKP